MKYLSLLCGLWFSLMAGFFFAYSATVFPGFELLQANNAMHAMQSINLAVQNVFFALGFWVAIFLAIASTVFALIKREAGWFFLLIGCLVYIFAAFGTTVGGNVPLNQALELMPITTDEGLSYWKQYQKDWLLLNNIRFGASFLAALIVLIPFGKTNYV